MSRHVVPVMHDRATQMAEHEPEHTLEYSLGSFRHAEKITRSHETESSGFPLFRNARIFFSMTKILPGGAGNPDERQSD
jgi:hypothetical protein